MAAREGQKLETVLLEGKPFDVLASHVEAVHPSLLLVGRIGVHHADGIALGSTAENLLRLANCNVLIVNRGVGQEEAGASAIEGAAERLGAGQGTGLPVSWDPDVEGRLRRVPVFLRNMVRHRIEGFARENGYRRVTAEVYDQARQRYGM